MPTRSNLYVPVCVFKIMPFLFAYEKKNICPTARIPLGKGPAGLQRCLEIFPSFEDGICVYIHIYEDLQDRCNNKSLVLELHVDGIFKKGFTCLSTLVFKLVCVIVYMFLVWIYMSDKIDFSTNACIPYEQHMSTLRRTTMFQLPPRVRNRLCNHLSS